MKVAVCYSGLYREFKGWRENHRRITKLADTVLHTSWSGQKNLPKDFITFSEPAVNYNPFEVKEFRERYPEQAKTHKKHPKRLHLTKQIIGHQLAVDSLTEQYDVIVKMRYDITLGDHDWLSFLKRSHDENVVIGFGGWTGDLDRNRSNIDRFIKPDNSNCGGKVQGALPDFMIIHPANKMKDGLRLHNEKKLFPANKGWNQVLVEPYSETPVKLAGGVMLTRHMVK